MHRDLDEPEGKRSGRGRPCGRPQRNQPTRRRGGKLCDLGQRVVHSQPGRSAFNTVPKRTNEDGTSNPNGPVHLTGVSIDFVSPNSIVTEITGYDETPWPDVSFTLSIGDTFSVSGSQVQVQSGTSLDVDQSFIDLCWAFRRFLRPS